MIASPLFYDKLMGRTIDLSQLVEVNDPFFFEKGDTSNYPTVGFAYRYSQTPQDKPLVYIRPLLEGPDRNYDLSIRDPNYNILDTAIEESFLVFPEQAGIRRRFILYEEDNPLKPKAMTRMEGQVENLRAAWLKWKQAEPEVYAIIRKHLS